MKEYLLQLIDNDIESVQRHLISVTKYIKDSKTEDLYYLQKAASLRKKIAKLEGYKIRVSKIRQK